MPLRTVRVPPEMAPLFEKAEGVVSAYFRARTEQPEEGTIEIFDERYVLVRGASLSVEFFGVTRDLLGAGREAEADEFSRNILFDLAHAMGKSDARNFHAKMGLVEPIEKLSAGPIHFAHAGWALVDISAESVPGSEHDFFLLYDHPYSFESDAWVKAGRSSDFPVCIMNAGYSSGWCEESFGIKLVAAEILCRARGDNCCRFVMANPQEIERHVAAYLKREPELGSRVSSYKIPDFFARKRLDDELRKAHDELRLAHDELEVRVRERTLDLERANEKLATEISEKNALAEQLLQTQKLEALGRLAGGIAHDFNNLLTIINGCAEAMTEEEPQESMSGRLAREILKAGERAAKLTGQLLVFGRQQVTSTETVDLGSIVSGMTEMLARLLGPRVTLATSISPGPRPLIMGNSIQMEQVVLNLIVNARDALPSGGTVNVRVDVLETARTSESKVPIPLVRLTVTDNGDGMDARTREHIFDPFFTTKNPGKGTGLGLSTVYGIVQQARGSISVESEEQKGSTFTLLFPLVDEPETAQLARAPSEPPTAHQRHTVLLVEDEDSVRDLLSLNLKKAGFLVVSATDAQEAMSAFHSYSGQIDLLLTDVVMPGQSGVDLARQLRAIQPDLPVVFLSGYADNRLRDGELEESGATFLSKPVKLAELRQTLFRLLGEPP